MIRIITDSSCDISQEEAKKLNIQVIPLRITFDTEEYLDGVTISNDQFYMKMENAKALPKTSQTTPFEYEQIFREVAEAGDTAVVMPISSKLSQCLNNAKMMAEKFPGVIYVVDSLNATNALRNIIYRAIDLRNEGKTAKEIAEIIEKEKSDVVIVGLLDTIEFLKLGGRITPALAAACNIFNIKPILHIYGGEILLLSKARGTKNGYSKFTDNLFKDSEIDFTKPCCFAYGGLNRNNLDSYLEKYSDRFENDGKLPHIMQIGCTIGTHVGPGTIIFSYFKKK